MRTEKITEINEPDRIISYFKPERKVLIMVAVSGIICNAGMIAGPYFEGQLAQCLFDIMGGSKVFTDMMVLALSYIAVIALVQLMRFIKRFFVRRFGNDTSRNMRHMLYNSIVFKSPSESSDESTGELMTKAVSDVDACAEGMRKFTTEIFDTGVLLIAYLTMLIAYDPFLTLISCAFMPVAYIIAGWLKKPVTECSAAYKESAGRLNNSVLDRISGALSYRIFGRESSRDKAVDKALDEYEKKAVASGIWENTMQPVYNIIAMTGVVFIVIFGARNISGTGWTSWNIAAFTSFLACFTKLAAKSSHAAKLFNAVQKAQVSWKRIKPLMKPYKRLDESLGKELEGSGELVIKDLSFSYPDGKELISGFNMAAVPGMIIGVTGSVACGKTAFGKLFLCEDPYAGSISFGGKELSSFSDYERSRLVAYMAHEPELMSVSIRENICLGDDKNVDELLRAVCFFDEVGRMPEGSKTYIGSGGVMLSGGQQARLALARTLGRNSRIIVLDDPFSAVDKNTEMQIFGNLQKLAKGSIVFIISHRLSIFPKLDRVIWMQDGKMTLSDHNELMKTQNEYAELYKKQEGGVDKNEE